MSAVADAKHRIPVFQHDSLITVDYIMLTTKICSRWMQQVDAAGGYIVEII
jgi:hypothetical protein